MKKGDFFQPPRFATAKPAECAVTRARVRFVQNATLGHTTSASTAASHMLNTYGHSNAASAEMLFPLKFLQLVHQLLLLLRAQHLGASVAGGR